jgi:hypothetical protein
MGNHRLYDMAQRSASSSEALPLIYQPKRSASKRRPEVPKNQFPSAKSLSRPKPSWLQVLQNDSRLGRRGPDRTLRCYKFLGLLAVVIFREDRAVKTRTPP